MLPIGRRDAYEDDRLTSAIAALSRSVYPPAYVPEVPMAHLLDPKRIDNETKYIAALEELDELMGAEPDAGADRRIDELFDLIEDYQMRKAHARIVTRTDVT
jgi:hypothetical protein